MLKPVVITTAIVALAARLEKPEIQKYFHENVSNYLIFGELEESLVY